MAIGALPQIGFPRPSQPVARGGVARGEGSTFEAGRHGQGDAPQGGAGQQAAQGAQAQTSRPVTPPHGLLSLQMDQIEALQGVARENETDKDKSKESSGQTSGEKSEGPGALTEEEEAVVRDLANTDREVRRHEQTHAAAGGAHAGAPSYQYQQGPDGKRYAVNGEVSIDTSPVQGDPKATIAKMRQVKAAANAPAQPSGQDRSVSAAASAIAAQAEAELRAQSAAQIGKGGPEEKTPEAESQFDASSPSDAPFPANSSEASHSEPGRAPGNPAPMRPPGSFADLSV